MNKTLLMLIIAGCMSAACTEKADSDSAPVTIRGDKNFLTNYPTFVGDCTINVVVEIPAGTNAKWETNKSGESIDWEFEDGVPRVVQYAPYPGNYGIVPRTLLPEEAGGDGDPLDVLVLSEAVPRGTVLPAVPVAVLGLVDSGEQDDKIIAVALDGPLSDVSGLEDLLLRYPGITDLTETWFSSYKSGRTESTGYRDEVAACTLVKSAAASFESAAGTSR